MNKRMLRIYDVIRDENRSLVRSALEAWSSPYAGFSAEPNLRASRYPVYQLTQQDAIDFCLAVDSSEIDLEQEAPRIRRFEEQLMAAIEGKAPTDMGDRQMQCLLLSAYISGIFIPAVSLLGEYDLAVNVVQHFLLRLMKPIFQDVEGAGNGHEGIEARFLFIAPCFAALAAHYPQEEHCN